MSGQNFADMIVHPDGLEEFDGIAFGLCGFLFARRAMFAFLFQFFAGERDRFAGEDIFLHEAMDQEIGIAANGGSEMGVMGESEAVVTDVIGGIDGLGLRSNRQ